MGDGTTDDLYIDPEDDDSGSPSGDEAPDIDPDQTGVDEYTDESPSEEAPSEDSGPSQRRPHRPEQTVIEAVEVGAEAAVSSESPKVWR